MTEMSNSITWNHETVQIDGKMYKVGIMQRTGKAPVQVKCDLMKLKDLIEAGEPVDEAVTIHRTT